MAAVEQSLVFFHEERRQAHEDRKELLAEIKDLRSSVDGLRQTMQSSQNILTSVVAQQSGDRLDELEEGQRIRNRDMANYKEMEADFLFWRRVLGSGFALLWKVVGLVIGSGFAGALITRWIH